MNAIIELGLFIKKEKVLVSSRSLANKFGKEHNWVLKRVHGYDRNGKHVNGILDDFESG